MCHAVHSFCLNRESRKDIWCDNSTKQDKRHIKKDRAEEKLQFGLETFKYGETPRPRTAMRAFIFLTNKDILDTLHYYYTQKIELVFVHLFIL